VRCYCAHPIASTAQLQEAIAPRLFAPANEVNSFDYLLTGVKKALAAKAAPDQWMPWNYHRLIL
jgi:hypothetical protein